MLWKSFSHLQNPNKIWTWLKVKSEIFLCMFIKKYIQNTESFEYNLLYLNVLLLISCTIFALKITYLNALWYKLSTKQVTSAPSHLVVMGWTWSSKCFNFHLCHYKNVSKLILTEIEKFQQVSEQMWVNIWRSDCVTEGVWKIATHGDQNEVHNQDKFIESCPLRSPLIQLSFHSTKCYTCKPYIATQVCNKSLNNIQNL